MAVFGTPGNTLVLGPFLVGPKTDQIIQQIKSFRTLAQKN
jgi:hypothetical protein